MRKSSYKDMKKFKKTVKAQKNRYYAKSQNARKSGERWTAEEIELVIAHEMTDTELSELIGRSVGSIQVMRSMVKKKQREREE